MTHYIEIEGTDYMVDGFDKEGSSHLLRRTCNLDEAVSFTNKDAAKRYLLLCRQRCRNTNFNLISL